MQPYSFVLKVEKCPRDGHDPSKVKPPVTMGSCCYNNQWDTTLQYVHSPTEANRSCIEKLYQRNLCFTEIQLGYQGSLSNLFISEIDRNHCDVLYKTSGTEVKLYRGKANFLAYRLPEGGLI